MNRRTFGSGLCSCTALALLGCATPRDGAPSISPGYRPSDAGEEANLWYQMAQAEEDLRQSPFLVQDAALNAYVREVACRVAQSYCADLRVYLVRTPHFNATMAPNGMMQVWSGLLLRVRNEAQLAAVLGHELGHYVRQHSLQRLRDTKAKANFAVFFRLGMALAGVSYAADLTDLILLASIYGFSREQEREADEFGLNAMADAGYSPMEASLVWQQLIREDDAAEVKRKRDIFFATHPDPEERAERLATLAASRPLPAPGEARFKARFMSRLQAHRAWMLRDELRLRQYGRTEALLDMLIEEGQGLGELFFCKGELYRHRADEGDSRKARDAYEMAISAGDAPPAVYRSLGLVLRRESETQAAGAAFRRYLELHPAAPDAPMIKSYLVSGS